LSAKWRRNKKPSRWNNILNPSKRTTTKTKPSHPTRTNIPTVTIKRKIKEPKPLIDILQQKNQITIIADLPGFTQENIRIHTTTHTLTIAAQNAQHKIHKTLNLPKPVNPQTTQTTYNNGVLQIKIRKQTKPQITNPAEQKCPTN
jgi:HSP20 family molecular chaperone IbpA